MSEAETGSPAEGITPTPRDWRPPVAMSDVEMEAPSAPPVPGETKPAADLLAQARKEASRALFTLAVLQLFFTGMIVLTRWLLASPLEPAALGLMLGFAAAFAGLGLWARSSPLLPAFIGLALYAAIAVGSIALGLVLSLLALLLAKSIHSSLKARRR